MQKVCVMGRSPFGDHLFKVESRAIHISASFQTSRLSVEVPQSSFLHGQHFVMTINKSPGQW
ncbi:uncharacterized protein BYT42DRAFT_567662 [Radiomyces spectabilis]|uniref:uncharacterized protein n=1 Tax=Radiomyces spectabilis TaxID=64574 RepID=UPI00222078D1|nr:uncharacterized protein BYT42DRAFT_567662 [Radiomyces spectabilis]KAI8379132.1 hypothetical protein BYT42DRAFT_567662 [Radiomyces spectabilis]